MNIRRHQDANQLAVLYYYSNAVHRAASVPDICQLGLTALQITLNVDRTSVLLLDRDGVQFRASRGIKDEYRRIDGFFPWSLEARDPQPLLIADVKENPACEALRDVLVGEGIQAIAFVPIAHEQRLLGQFILCFNQPHEFTIEEVELAQTIASHVAFAAERKRVETALREGHRLLEGILEGYAEQVKHQLEMPAILATVHDSAGGESMRFGAADEVVSSRKEYIGASPATNAEPGGPSGGKASRVFGLARDLRSRNLLEEALRESEERFRAMSACSPVGLMMIDSQSRCLYMNARCQLIFGMNLEQALGNGWLRFIHPEDSETFLDRWYSRLKQEREFRITARFKPGEGVTRWVELKITPLFYERQLAGYVSTVEDVTAQRTLAEQQSQLLSREQHARAEAEIKQKQFEFLSHATQVLGGSLEYETTVRTLAQLAVSMLSDWCEVYLVTDSRAGALRKHAVTHRDPARVKWTEQLQQDYESDVEMPGTVSEVLKSGESVAVASISESSLGLKDARHLRILRNLGTDSALFVPLVGRSEVIGAMCLFSSAETNRTYGPTEISIAEELASRAVMAIESAMLYRRALEAQWRMGFLAEASKVLMSSLNYDATFTNLARLAVPSIADYCVVYSCSEDGTTLHRKSLVHSDPEREKLLSMIQADQMKLSPELAFAQVLRSGKPLVVDRAATESVAVFAGEANAARVLNEIRPQSVLVLPLQMRGKQLGIMVLIMNGSGRFYSASDLTVVEEVANRASAAIDNARLYSETQDANRVKEEFLATLSHELRTPLTAIVGYARLLMSRKLDEPAAHQAVQSLYRNAQLQSQLISDLLDISRIVTGKLKLVMEPLDLTAIIEAALDSVRLAAEAKAIKLQFTADPFVGTVIGDPDRLQQIIWNLVSNSIKFTPPEGRIEVRLKSMGGHALIKVIDSGAGVSPEFLPHVFEKFRQADNSPTRQNSGLGLGLAIVRHLVEMHGGTVKADSQGLGQGATFTVKLPLQTMALRQVS